MNNKPLLLKERCDRRKRHQPQHRYRHPIAQGRCHAKEAAVHERIEQRDDRALPAEMEQSPPECYHLARMHPVQDTHWPLPCLRRASSLRISATSSSLAGSISSARRASCAALPANNLRLRSRTKRRSVSSFSTAALYTCARALSSRITNSLSAMICISFNTPVYTIGRSAL